jgi:hypothetical protein
MRFATFRTLILVVLLAVISPMLAIAIGIGSHRISLHGDAGLWLPLLVVLAVLAGIPSIALGVYLTSREVGLHRIVIGLVAFAGALPLLWLITFGSIEFLRR